MLPKTAHTINKIPQQLFRNINSFTLKASGLQRRSRDCPVQYMSLAVQLLGISSQQEYPGQLWPRGSAHDQRNSAVQNGEISLHLSLLYEE